MRPRSPDGAKRNPGTAVRPHCRPRISLRSIRATKERKKEKKETERRETRSHEPRPPRSNVTVRRGFGRGAAQRRGGSPLGVPSRFSPVGCHLPAQLQARLPGTRTLKFARRALPAPSCPSPEAAPLTPAVVPERVMPRAARARRASPRAGTAPRSDRPACRPRGVLDERGFNPPL
jgi:hypothetical protein